MKLLLAVFVLILTSCQTVEVYWTGPESPEPAMIKVEAVFLAHDKVLLTSYTRLPFDFGEVPRDKRMDYAKAVEWGFRKDPNSIFVLFNGESTAGTSGLCGGTYPVYVGYSPSDPSRRARVIMHEIGHALGLPHSNLEGSVMGINPDNKLDFNIEEWAMI
jgi:hypothetical protein